MAGSHVAKQKYVVVPNISTDASTTSQPLQMVVPVVADYNRSIQDPSVITCLWLSLSFHIDPVLQQPTALWCKYLSSK
jgi:hypothetical protein